MMRYFKNKNDLYLIKKEIIHYYNAVLVTLNCKLENSST